MYIYCILQLCLHGMDDPLNKMINYTDCRFVLNIIKDNAYKEILDREKKS